MKIYDLILNVIYPPRCAMCGKLLEPDEGKYCFCMPCRSLWEQEKTVPCPVCRRPAEDCTCGIKFNKSRTVDSCRSVTLYSSKNVRNTINKLKTEQNDALITFVSRELEMLIFRKTDLQKDEHLIAFPERSISSRKKYGFDQAETIAGKISKDLDIPLFCGIKNKSRREQKKLTAKERGQNAYQSYHIPEKYRTELKGKRVIFIDDIVTSGATAVTAAALCKMYGALSVECFFLARTPL